MEGLLFNSITWMICQCQPISMNNEFIKKKGTIYSFLILHMGCPGLEPGTSRME